MGQSLSQIYVHLTFGTKYRYPFLSNVFEDSLHAYMGGILRKYNSPSLIINSVPDHVHILFQLSKNYALAKIVEEVKKSSSAWVKEQEEGSLKFAWQGGYGAFSVSSSALLKVKHYISNQKAHHRKMTYQEEVEEFVKEYNMIKYEEEYYWR